jgi:hypothetical protein
VKEFLDKLIWDGLPNLTILITCQPLNCLLESVYTDSYEHYFSVDPLPPKEAAFLFLDLIRQKVTGKEITDLIEEQSNYPFEKLGMDRT